MVNERSRQIDGSSRPGFARPLLTASQTASQSASHASQLGIGLGKGAAGLGGIGKGKGVKRHQSVLFSWANIQPLEDSGKYNVIP